MQSNRLLQESSPYLLQHAYNPVDWYPWGEEALSRARQEDKPIIVSIGYSACHWCHVMEHESFEDEEVATLMNRDFVCIKVDREERPDIDQIYMEAVQLMDQRGGWPLNVFLTPDGSPFYGGTYFPKDHWMHLLKQVSTVFRENRQDLNTSAQQVRQALNQPGLQFSQERKPFSPDTLKLVYDKMAKRFDPEWGGTQGAPKFPMPSIWHFVERYHRETGDQEAANWLRLTLDKMAQGGIYDQLGGGFARYSVDGEWFAPHFEKMLYDNAQLVSLYARAAQLLNEPSYAAIVRETVAFIGREMTCEEGGFFSALDADSEGEEGRFYTWPMDELKATVGEEEAQWLAAYYGLTESGNWENGRNILFRTASDEAFAKQQGWSADELQRRKAAAHEQMMAARDKRPRPGLDDKILTSWNGLMLEGLATAFAMQGGEQIAQLADQNANFIRQHLWADGHLWHSYKNGKATIMGYLEDYAAAISGFTAYYQINFDRKWMDDAAQLMEICLEHFYDEEEGLFFFTDQRGEQLIARKKEVFDNVIPSSNSIMARNLIALGQILDKSEWVTLGESMLGKMQEMIPKFGGDLGNWAQCYADAATQQAEVAIVGPAYREQALALRRAAKSPFVAVAAAEPIGLPLLQNRKALHETTTFYVCYGKACQLPVNDLKAAVAQLDQ